MSDLRLSIAAGGGGERGVGGIGDSGVRDGGPASADVVATASRRRLRLRRGEQTAPGERFAALYRDCAADVFAYIASMLGDRASAEDVTALAFERAFRARRRHDPERGSERAWLFGIARNAALDELRRRRRRPHVDASARVQERVEERGEELGEELEQAIVRATVRAALAALEPRERELVVLRFHGQLSHAELARVLGVSESNAATRLHRALTRLRAACLEEVA